VTASPLPDRIVERAERAGVPITPEQVNGLARYYELLGRWNPRINLTALRLDDFPDVTIDRLLIEPLIAAPFIEDTPLIWFDLGSGGGSPAIPIKLLRPATRLTMVESRSRKTAFLREAVRTLELGGTSVWTGRLEDLPESGVTPGSAALVTVRAVKVDVGLLAVAGSLLETRGQLVLFGTSAAEPQVNAVVFELLGATPLPLSDGMLRRFVKR
jgi:16S rRNA (guanine527-N7)-methyltransferase